MSKLKCRELPTQDRLRELFDYDNGELFNRTDRANSSIGSIATRQGHHAVVATVNGVVYNASRLIWVWHFGAIPEGLHVAHINKNVLDNRIANLRLATKAEIVRSAMTPNHNTSGYKGVCFCKNRNKWHTQIVVNYRTIHLGRFDTKEEAHAAYCVAAKKYFGEFANFGSPRQYDRPHQKDAPPSSGQMTGGAGATGMATMAQSANEANHNVSLTDQAPAVQVQEHYAHIAAKRQTEVVEAITGTRFCKRCAGHRKSDGGTYLRDALSRRYWVCQTCTNSFHGDRGDSASADAERVAP